MYLLDLHVHYKRRARCVEVHAGPMVQAAMALGLHGLAFTEHGEMLDSALLDARRAVTAPFMVYSGVELSLSEGDFLVYGLPAESLGDLFAAAALGYRVLRKVVRDRGGAICLAHPCRRGRPVRTENWENWRPDAMEIRSRNTPVAAYGTIAECCRKWKVRPMMNSDAHQPRRIGSFFNLFDRLPESDAELAAAMRGDEGAPRILDTIT